LTAMGGLADDRVSAQEIEEWETLTTHPFKVHLFEGDHFFLRANQNQKELLQIIEETLCLMVR
jgi:medium-chain acyl-[acyl-carrier-protein] hydrolase